MQTLYSSLCLFFILMIGSFLPLSGSSNFSSNKEISNNHLSSKVLSDVQFDILMELYNTTDGTNWNDNTNWGTSAPLEEWYGIEATNGIVTSVNLRNNNLIGFLRSSLGDLPNLKILNLAGNNLTGEIPTELGNLTNLEILGLSNSNLTGNIPNSLSNLSNLKELTLQGNNLTGGIPQVLGNLNNLEHINISNNELIESIPSSLGNLSNLKQLFVSFNNLTGDIPASLGNLSNLEILGLQYNNLTGDIPTTLGDLTNLTKLILNNNNLTGEIPASLGNLSNLKNLNLQENALSGPIPTTLGNLSNIEFLVLYNNQLTGEIPASLGNFSNLRFLRIQNNNLSFSFPDSFLGYCNSSTTIDALDNPQMTEDDFDVWCNGDSCGSIADAGEISYGGFSGFVDELDPDVITGTIPTMLAANGTGIIQYQWEEKIEVGNWNQISNATSQNYDPPLITEMRCYRRKAKVDCQTTWLTSNEFCFISCVDENNFSDNTNLSREKDCTLIEDILQVEISNYCDANESGTITLKGIDNPKYEIFWNTGERTSNLDNLYEGAYCVTITDADQADCSLTACYKIRKDATCESLTTYSNKLIINEVSNGLGYGGEYIELLVVGDADCGTVDIRGFIIDDNNGAFSKNNVTSGTGIAPGHIRLSHNESLKDVPVGSIILIYNPAYKNDKILLEDDPHDLNKDHVYIMPIDDPILIGNEDSPSIANLSFYEYSPDFELATWNSIWLYDYADALQIRNPDGSYHYGLSYGLDLVMQGGPDSLHVHPSNLLDRVISFTGGDFLNVKNFNIDFRYNSIETPGYPNNNENQAYITSLCDNIAPPEEVTPQTDLAINIYPNPFQDVFYLEMNSDKNMDTQLELYDILGRQVMSSNLTLVEGYNKITLDPENKVGNGTYFLIIKSGKIRLVNHKLICIK